jgi:tripartite-type tricarboxylate transporter receptor subunit TctC
VARVILNKMSEGLKQPIVLESRPGAGGVIGSDYVAKAAPDGYTLLVSHVGPTAITPAMQQMPYDSVADFAPISQLVSGPLILVVPADAPYKTIRDVVDAAKAAPGQLSYGSIGAGSTTHLAGAMLALSGKVDFLHVPYKGGAPVITDLLGKRISFGFLSIAAGALPQIEAGRLRPIAVTTLQRSALFPNLPTVDETYPGFEVNSWYGLMAPAGTPKEIVNLLYAEVAKSLKSPDVIQRLKTAGLDTAGTSPEQYAAKIKDDLARWRAFIKETGITGN